MAGYSEKCSVCNHDAVELVEAHGAEALAGIISWRAAALPFNVRSEALKRHMEAHVVAVEQAEAAERDDAELDALILRARQELVEQFDFVPADIKPLILVAIQNLDGLKRSKPSMETLIKSLKTIQEMTGMKNEQRLLLEYAGAQRRKPIQVTNEAQPAIEGGEQT